MSFLVKTNTPKNRSDQELLFDIEQKYPNLLLVVAEEAVDKLNLSFARNSVARSGGNSSRFFISETVLLRK